MKKITLVSIAGLLIVAAFAIFAAFQMGDKSPILAAGTVEISEDIVRDARGIRTLFIVVHDEASQMPMPYGAIKINLDEDAKGKFYEFKLTKDNLRIMNTNGPVPKSLLMKARLDLDGQGGRAQPGDLLGELTTVEVGSENLNILINTVVGN